MGNAIARIGVGIAVGCGLAATVASSRTARAQANDIVVPTLVFDASAVNEAPGDEGDTELDLANVVQSVARGVTTTQEAPAIVTVVTADEIRARGYKQIEQVLDVVPGWLRLTSQLPVAVPMTRGVQQSSLFMHDGLSLFDPHLNIPSLYRIQPLETIKRVELVTGPGGVLWGANSFLGIINIVTKDADDIDGVEVGVAGTDGDGDRASLRGYVLAGVPELFDTDSELVLHGAFETFRGPGIEVPSRLYQTSPQFPNSPTFYGPLTRGEPARSMLFITDGKLRRGPLTLAFQVPFVERHTPTSLGGLVIRHELGEDTLEDPDMPGTLACPFEEPFVDPNDRCLDKGRTTRDTQLNFFERYLSATYRVHDDGGSGATFKAYGVQFKRAFSPVGFLNAVPVLLEGGLAFNADLTTYRIGAAVDGEVALGGGARILAGVEGFREWAPVNTTTSRQAPGSQADLIAPLELSKLPLPCPREPDPDSPGRARIMAGCPLTFAFEAERMILAAYVNPQLRLGRSLILDAGARLQVAPAALSLQPYALTPTFSGALVYQPIRDWHVKLNVAQGFRPPAFNNTASNSEAVTIDGDPDLEVETSDAVQAELNARIFKGERRLREISFRADYSYTRLENYIDIIAGRYENSADRGIHSAEALAKIYVQGGHSLELAYTYLQTNTADVGVNKGLPEHWFNVTGVFSLIPDRVLLMTHVRVVGATEDPNLMVEYRDLGYDEGGASIDLRNGMPGYATVDPHEVVLDRLPASGELTVGVTVTPTSRLRISAFTYNTFHGRSFQSDSFSSYEQRIRQVPNPHDDFAARIAVTYHY